MPLTDQELIAERTRAQALADLCEVHGHTDGRTAHRATVAAITAEQLHRERGGTPQ